MPDVAGNNLNTATVLNPTTSVQTVLETVTSTASDYYRFRLNNRSSFNLSLTGLTNNADVVLLNSSGTPLSVNGVTQSSSNPGTFTESINTQLDAGVYYIRVSTGTGATSADYNLSYNLSNILQPNLLWRDYINGQNVIWYVRGGQVTSVGSLPDPGQGWLLQATGEFNGDGQPDVLWRNSATGDNVVWFTDGSSLIGGIQLPTVPGNSWQMRGLADFNGDGQGDILWRNSETGDNIVWLMNGSTIAGGLTLPSVSGNNWQIQAVGDFNNDSFPDLFWRNSAGENIYWLTDPTGLIGGGSLTTVAGDSWQIQGVGDFNQDRQLDILWRNFVTGDNLVWVMNGTTIAAGIALPTVPGANWQAVAPFTSADNPAPIDLAGNTTQTAFDLGSGLTGSASYSDAVGGFDSNDFFKFSLSTRSNVNLALNGLTANLELELLGSTGALIQSSTLTGNASESISRTLDSGTYYVRVFPVNDINNSSYSLGLAINNLPVLATNTGLTLDEATTSTIGSGLLTATDNDNAQAQLSYVLTRLPDHGQILLNGVALITGSTFTQADITDGTRLRYQHDGSETVSDSFSFDLTDGVGGVLTGSLFNITVNPVNDPPALTVPPAQTIDQGSTVAILGTGLADSDADPGNLTVTITVGVGLLSLFSRNGLTFAQGTGTDDSTMTFSGTVTAINAALTALIYRSNPNAIGQDTITINVTDNGNTGSGGAKFDVKTIDITITQVNKPPAITLPAAQTVSEDISQTISGISIADPDAAGGNVTVSLALLNGTVTLGATGGLTFTTGTGIQDRNMVFSGSLAVVNNALSTLVYRGSQDFTGTDALTINVSDNGNTGSGVPLSDSKVLAITVNPRNDAPVLTVPANLSVNENSSVRVTGVSVADVDAVTGNLTVSLAVTNGTLSLGNLTGLTFSTGSGTADASMIFSGTLAAINNALNTLTYRGSSNFNGSDSLSISVNDNGNTGAGIALSDSRTIAINILGVNQPPSITVPLAPEVNSGVDLRITGVSISDPDAASGDVTVSIAAANGVLSLPTTPGVTFQQGTGIQNGRITIRGSLGAINTALNNLTYRSNPGFVGFETIVLGVSDEGNSGFGTPLSDTKTLFVNVGGATNTAPTATDDTYSIIQNGTLTIPVTGVLSNDTDPDGPTKRANLISLPTRGTLNFNSDGSFVYTPQAGFAGTDTFTYQANDGIANSDRIATVTLNVTIPANNPPVAISDNFNLNEDPANPFTGNVLLNDTDQEDGRPQTVQLSNVVPNHGLLTLNADGSFTYQPNANYNGLDTFSYIARDSQGANSTPATVTLTINPVNDAPSFTRGANQTATVTTGAQTVTNWASNISAGPADEAGQSLSFQVSVNNPTLFSVGPAIDPSGTLTYTPATTASGTATVTVSLRDSGGTANGGVDTSAPQTFTIVLNPGFTPNQPPTFTAGNSQTTVEDSGAQTVAGWATNISPGAPSETGQSLTFQVSNSNSSLFSTQPTIDPSGTLTYTAAPNANGVATLTVTLRDDGGTNGGGADTSTPQTFTIGVTPVNDAPSFNNSGNLTIDPASGAQTVTWATNISAGPADEAGQSVSFQVTVSDPTLFSEAPTIAPNGVLTYTPVATASGTATVTVSLRDSGGTANGGIDTSAPQTFTIALNPGVPPNQPPSFTVGADQTTVEDSGAQTVAGWATNISPGAPSETGQSLTFQVSNSNSSLFSTQPTIDPSGTLTYTTAPDANGVATVTVTLRDDGGTSGGGSDTSTPQTFTIGVTPVNDAPGFTAGGNQTVNPASGPQTVTWATNISAGPADEAGQSVSFQVTASDPTLFSEAPTINSNGVLTYTPTATATGTVTVTAVLQDSGGTANSGVDTSPAQTFTIVFDSAGTPNQPPSFTVGADQTTVEDSGAQTVAGWATNISPGAPSETGQSLTFQVSNSNSSLFSTQPTIDPSGTLTYTTAPDANGVATVTVTLRDDGGTSGGGSDTSTPQTFTIGVTPVNDAPGFTAGGNQTVNPASGPQTVTWATNISAGPADEAGQSVSFQVTASDPTLFSEAPTINSNGVLTYTPTATATGTVTVTAVLQDSGGTANSGVDTSPAQTFTIVLDANLTPNQPPTFTVGADQTVAEDSAAQTITGWATNISPGAPSETAQSLTFQVSNSNTSLFSSQPTIDPSGTLTYTTAPDANGVATLTVTLQDDGGTSGGGSDTSTPQTFTIGVTPVNDAPSFSNIGDLTVSATNGAQTLTWATNIVAGPTPDETSTQSVSFQVSVSDPSQFTDVPTIDPGGVLTFTPTTTATGTVTVTVTLSDDGGTNGGGVDTSPAQLFTITFQPNQAPVANADGPYRVLPGLDRTVNTIQGLLNNDFDDGPIGGLSVVVGSPIVTANGGTVTLNTDGSFVYTPNATVTLGTDVFTYQVTDGALTSNTATVSLSIGPNTAPVANPDNYRAVLNQTRTIDAFNGVLRNDTDAEGDSRFITPTSGSTSLGGLFNLNADGSFTYTPAGSATIGQVDTFTYQVSDGFALSNTATVSISLVVNNPPQAEDDFYLAVPGRTKTITPINGVINNDTDEDGDPKLVIPATGLTSQGGSYNLNADGSFTYIPAANATVGLVDTFTYQATDGITPSNTATVTISLTTNIAPSANNFSISSPAFSGQSTTFGGALGLLTQASDGGDGPTLTVVGGTQTTANGGTVALNPDGSFVYTPAATLTSGTDTFTYQVDDGIDISNLATVTLTVITNTPPTAVDDNYTIPQNFSLTVPGPGNLPNLISNDLDPDPGNQLRVVFQGLPVSGGGLQLNDDGTFVYTPPSGFQGVDSFRYRVTDGFSTSANQGTVFITVTAGVVAPTATPDSYSVNTNNTLSVGVSNGLLSNDFDIAPLTASLVSNPTQGTVSLNPNGDGSFVYTPGAGSTGTDTFVYQATAGTRSATATVTINIATTSNPPIVQDNSYTLNSNNTLTVTSSNSLLQNDSDPDGDQLQVVTTAPVTTTQGQTVTLNADGTFVYAPPSSGFFGQDTFVYQATDGINTVAATVTINVGSVNQAPVITVPPSQSSFRNTELTIANGISIADPDAGNNTVQVSVTSNNGSLFLNTTNGLTVTDPDGDKSIVVRGTLANINAALASLRYNPDDGFVGSDQIVITVDDLGNTGGDGPKTSNSTIEVAIITGANLVKDINPNTTTEIQGSQTVTVGIGSNPSNLTAIGNTLYFSADDGFGGVELWRSDGTEAGTTLVKDINTTFSNNSSPNNLTQVGNILYFTADNGVNGTELWQSDGTEAGTVLVQDLVAGSLGSNPANLISFNNRLFFRATDASGVSSIYQIPSPGQAPVRLTAAYNQPSRLTVVGNSLFFAAVSGGGNTQLWKTDGTNGGTVLVQDLGAPASFSNPIAIGNSLFFTATNSFGNELWRSNNTTGVTERVSDINPAGSSNPRNLVNLGGTLYFLASNGSAEGLYRMTETGTTPSLVQSLSAGQVLSNLTVVGSSLFFTVRNGSEFQLWRSDGTTVTQVNSTTYSSLSSLTSVGGNLFFVGTDTTGIRIWRSDGTAAGTTTVSSAFTSLPTGLTSLGGRLYFAAPGTVTETVLVPNPVDPLLPPTVEIRETPTGTELFAF